jgi:hypothetical protein
VPQPAEPAPHLAELLVDAGLEVLVEGGVVRGELNGLEVARVVHGASSSGVPLEEPLLEVGVGQADRELTAMLHGTLAPTEQLARVIELVSAHRRPGAPPHPLNQLVPERWLRARLVAHPERIGLEALRPVETALPRPNLRDRGVAAALGTDRPARGAGGLLGGRRPRPRPPRRRHPAGRGTRARSWCWRCPSGTPARSRRSSPAGWRGRPASSPSRGTGASRGRGYPWSVLERLADLEREFNEVEARLADPDLIADQARYQEVTRRYRELEAIVTRTRELRQRTEDLETAREMLRDVEGEDRDVVRAEIDDAEAVIARLNEEIRLLLLPKDPNDDKNVIVEIRGAEGGEEANLFARDLFEMYQAYASRMGWKSEVLGSDPPTWAASTRSRSCSRATGSGAA